MIRIALVGYGKMGRAIERVVKDDVTLSKSVTIAHIIDDYDELRSTDLSGCVAIDFSTPKTILQNITHYIDNQIKVVVGTTGWDAEMEEVQKRVNTQKTSLLYGANFSIGVNLFLRLLESSFEVMKKKSSYDTIIKEAHHRHKQDSPSGTALQMVRRLEKVMKDKQVVYGVDDRPLKENEVNVVSERGGHTVGYHEVLFDGAYDSISITHNAKSRDGFARGAIECAIWLSNRQGFFTVDDYIQSII